MTHGTSLQRQTHLDGLRALAVILVLLAHFPVADTSGRLQSLWMAMKAARPGYIGVEVFFVLSGFLITRILIAERVQAGCINLSMFYINRALRIFPIYYLCVIVCALLFAKNIGMMLSLATYTVNYYHPLHPDPYPLEHGWSLAVEEQFYVLWPLAVAHIPLRLGTIVTALIIPLIAIGAAIGLTATLDPELAGAYIYKSLATQAISLSVGAAIAFLSYEGRSIPFWRCVGLSALGGAILVGDLVGRAHGSVAAGGRYWCIALVGYTLLSFGAVAMLTIGRPPRLLASGLSWGPLVYLGRISYGIYLYHLVILYMLGINEAANASGTAPVTTIVAALLLTLLVSGLSFAFIESRFLRMRKWVTRSDPL
ncbi:acyltransferase family protein [Methylobacterium sp. ID0610]|uniref:acyltransferase family protein n=1 Tax=Methylobacterium carpenticola TaxID=3344827 RepID=UPI003679A112